MTTTALLKKEFTEQWRTSKVLILAIGFFLLGVMQPVTIKLLPDLLKNSSSLNNIQITVPKQTAIDALFAYFNGMSLMPVLVLILVAMGTLAGERERGTQVFVLTKPVTRTQFILSKFFSYGTSLVAVMLMVAAAVAYYTLLLFESFDIVPYLVMNLTLISFMLFMLAIIILCSSLFKTALAAGGMSFLIFIVLNTGIGFIPNGNKYSPFAVFMPENRLMLTGTTPTTDLIVPILAGLVLTGLVLAVACIVYERREM